MDVMVVPPGKTIKLKKDYDPGFTGDFMKKKEAKERLAEGVKLLAEYQDKLYAQDNYALLIVLQAMDAAGKDGTIRHVMSGLNPQGTQVYSFKAPSAEELDQTYLWRNFKALPERGRIGIFNRSYYEEVLIARVHPTILDGQKLPADLKDKKIWKRRYEEINNFEKYLVNNGTIVLKFFLNVSKEEQRRRFLARVDLPEKNWKFSSSDLKERAFWDDYQAAYEDVFNNTSMEWAPWYVVPADNKWFTRLAVASVIYSTLRGLKLAYPTVDDAKKQDLLKAKAELEADGGPIEIEADKKNDKKKKQKEQEGEQA
ncbi:MAG TPA: polyphosphate kinase 2 family protein [Anaerolineae bacterium]|nr:polyphosphate kinase 2 family protein [Anaerolineae bacterium]